MALVEQSRDCFPPTLGKRSAGGLPSSAELFTRTAETWRGVRNSAVYSETVCAGVAAHGFDMSAALTSHLASREAAASVEMCEASVRSLGRFVDDICGCCRRAFATARSVGLTSG